MEYLFLRRKKNPLHFGAPKDFALSCRLSPMGEGVCVADGRPPDRCSYI